MKIATYNVNSVRSRLPNLLEWLAEAKPDVVCLQEIKCQDEQFPRAEIEAAGYKALVHGQKAYNGVAILSKVDAKEIGRANGALLDGVEQSRYLEADIGGVRVINIYAPNGNPISTEKFPYKLDWLRKLQARMRELLDNEIPFVVTGDYNIIPEPIDVHNPNEWLGDALFQPESRGIYREMLNMGLTDAVRIDHKGAGVYTFWDYQAGSWQRDNGIRIDHFLMSPQIADRFVSSEIHKDARGRDKASDHTPVSITISMPSKATS